MYIYIYTGIHTPHLQARSDSRMHPCTQIHDLFWSHSRWLARAHSPIVPRSTSGAFNMHVHHV